MRYKCDTLPLSIIYSCLDVLGGNLNYTLLYIYSLTSSLPVMQANPSVDEITQEPLEAIIVSIINFNVINF